MEYSTNKSYEEAKKIFENNNSSLEKKVDDAIGVLSGIIKDEKYVAVEVYAFLLLCYFQKDMIIQACYLIAKYNLPCDFSPIYYDVPVELRLFYEESYNSYEDYLFNRLLDDEIYQQVIRFVNDNSYELAKILICISKIKKRKEDILRLSHCINDRANMETERKIRYELLMNGCEIDLETNPKIDFNDNIDLMFAADRLSDLICVNEEAQIIKDEINNAYKLYRHRKNAFENTSYGELDYFWSTFIAGLIHLKQYSIASKIYFEKSNQISDPSFFWYSAKALLEIGNKDDAIEACRKSCSKEQNSENLLTFGHLLYSSKQYEEAKNVYIDVCNLLYEKKKMNFFYKGSLKCKKYSYDVEYEKDEIQNIKKHAYSAIFYCYIMMKDFASAEQLVKRVENEGIDAVAFEQMKSILELNLSSSGEIEKLKSEKVNIEEAFELEREKNNQYKEYISNIENMLNQIRTGDATEIDDIMWDTQFSKKMGEIVSSIREQLDSNKENAYAGIYKDIEKRYPKMSKETIRTLASAEQMYYVFSNNVYIDQAPIIMEFSRAVEMLLWDYVDNSNLYLEEIKEACSYRDQGKTFGAVNSVINCQKCPLRQRYNKLEDLRKTRNNSVHVTDKGPKMTLGEIHDLIWLKGGCLKLSIHYGHREKPLIGAF